MRVVVTGGLGFVGSHLCVELARAGHEPVAVDDLSGTRAPGLARPECEVVVDTAERIDLDAADAVIHLAAVPGVRSSVPARRLAAANVELARTLAAGCAARGTQFVLASTSSVYGNADERPTPESAPYRPLNDYARSKAAAEAACPEAVITRLFTVYGPGQRPDMAFARWIDALDAGAPIAWCAPDAAERDFTYVGDAARGLVAALEHGRAGQAYNIGGGAPTPVRAALAELETIVGTEGQLARFEHGVGEARATAACGRKALAELGYAPAVSLREGLEAQVEAALAVRRPAIAA